MNTTLQIPLDIPNIRLLSSRAGERGELILEVENNLDSTKCRHCGREITEFHGYDRPIQLRHLPIFERVVLIEIRPKRYRCRHCEGDPSTTQKLDWYDPRSPHTRAFERWLLKMLGNSTVMDVARRCDIGYDAVEGALNRWIKTAVNWDDFKHLHTLGVDEIALKKGHKHYVAIITVLDDNDQPQILAVLPDRLKDTVVKFFNSIPKHLKATVHRVCSDMHEGYAHAVKEALPTAELVVDRFHVAQYYHRDVDNFRKQTLADLKDSVTPETYQTCKGTMWLFRRHYWSLTEEQRQHLAMLLILSPQLQQAWLLRHELTLWFQQEQTKPEATLKLEHWKEKVRLSGITCFDKFINLLATWQDSITNYFNDRHTSGFVEGLNNKLKVIKRRCYGLFDPKRLFQQIQLDLLFSRGKCA